MEDNEASSAVTTSQLEIQRPIEFGLTAEGGLTVTWQQALLPDGSRFRAMIVIPAEEVKILRRCLEESATIQETLSAKRPAPGAH